jgi:Putative viral replication protein/RNA helicase
MSRSCNFTFTYNNYPDTSLVDELECRYIVYGKEIGASGTPHLQGTVMFPLQHTVSSVIKKLPGLHIEVCKALDQSMAYCKKDGDFTERGTPPISKDSQGKGEKRRWGDIRVACEEGRFDELPDEIRYKNLKLNLQHRNAALRAQPLEDSTAQMLWYYGPSGTGKSRKARTDYPDAYLKMCNKWWDGYTNQHVVIIEDFDIAHGVLNHHLKIWGDRYPFPAEIKGDAINIRPRLIIVTSNYHPREIWDSAPALEPIGRAKHITGSFRFIAFSI